MAKLINKGGRPPRVFTRSEIKKVETLSAVLTVAQLADYFGISENTFREVRVRQPEVSEAYKKGRSKAIAGVASNLVNQAQKGNVAAAIFYLKTQAGWREVDEQAAAEASKPQPVKVNIEVQDGRKP